MAGYIPSAFFDDVIKNFKVNKIKVIQNLQKHGYIANDKADKHVQINGKRPYSYKLGIVWLDMVNNLHKKHAPKVTVPLFPDRHMDRQFELLTGTDE